MRTTLSISALLILATTLTHPLFAATTGWRGDGSGVFPAATPPTEWSPTKNVIWETPMTAFSNASPIIVGDKLFICNEPYELVCLNAKDGKILWRHSNTIIDTLPEAEREQAKVDKKRSDELTEQINKRSKQIGKNKKLLKKAEDKTELAAAIKADSEQLAKDNAEIAKLNKYLPPKKHKATGTSTATPTTDRKTIYTIFGNGVCAAYDLEGNRKWCVFLERSKIKWGLSASPVLADGKIIFHVNSLFALDASTGKKLWQTKSKNNNGSPILVTIGAEPCIATTSGDIVRVKDGKAISKKLHNAEFNAPTQADNVLFYIDAKGGRAIQLPTEAGDDLKTSVLWDNKPKKARYYGSPTVHDGLLYTVNAKGFFSVFDAKDGTEVYTESLKLKKGTYYPSPTIAGEHVFICNDNGTTLIIKTGRTFTEVAQCTLEGLKSSPVFLGDKMFVRCKNKMYCIGTK